MRNKPALLIITYMRYENVALILKHAIDYGIDKFYVTVDGRRDKKLIDYEDEFYKALSEVIQGSAVEILVRFSESNLGCAASVLAGCEWVFDQESYVAILEDDCIPTSDFFEFVTQGFPVLNDNDDYWLICGTQFAPTDLTRSIWVKSRYPLIWGWATTQDKWREMACAIKNFDYISTRSDLRLSEVAFWNSGARRAYFGYVDAWDTVLAQQMLMREKFAILPGQNLVENVGNDSFATHTKGDSKWLQSKTGHLKSSSTFPVTSSAVEQWLQRDFYRIGKSNLIRFFLSLLRDKVLAKGDSYKSLVSRWEVARNSHFKLVKISNRF